MSLQTSKISFQRMNVMLRNFRKMDRADRMWLLAKLSDENLKLNIPKVKGAK